MSEILFCPKCPNLKEMQPIPQGEIEIDACPKCQGIWFDKGEISESLQLSEDLPEFQKVLKQARRTDFTCPRCMEHKMVEMKFISEDPLLLDYCEYCRGIWLDSGEFDHLQGLMESDGSEKLALLKSIFRARKSIEELF